MSARSAPRKPCLLYTSAVLRVSADEAEGEPGTICDVLQTGYRVKGKMLRHPMVKVIED